MLVLLHTAPLAYPPRKSSARITVENTLLLSITAIALISSLYYTHAPQLLHASPPTRAFSHTQDDPCGTVTSRTTHAQDTHLTFPTLEP
jgi:hypothetical protein